MRYVVASTVLFAMLLAGVSLPIARSQAPSGPNIGQALGSAPKDQIRELRGTVQTVDRETKLSGSRTTRSTYSIRCC